MSKLFPKLNYFNDKNDILFALHMVFATSLVVANCIAAKLWMLPIELMGAPILLTVGAISYPITFLVTDVIGEVWGKQHANRAVILGFFCQIVALIIILIATALPTDNAELQASFSLVFGQTGWFVAASMISYLTSQSFDVYIFHKVRDKYIEKKGSTKGGRWIWNNISTITSQLIDSVMFVSIAFGLGFKWFFTAGMFGPLFSMILGMWLVKVALAILDTPFFYLITNKLAKLEAKEAENV